MKWFARFICCVLIVLGILAGIDLNKFLKAESAEFIATQKESTYLLNFTVTNVGLEKENNSNTWFYETTLSPISFDATKNDYEVLFNDKHMDTDVNNGQIQSNCKIVYIQPNGDRTEENLKIELLFYSSQTKLKFETFGDSSAGTLLTTCLNNGFNIKIKEMSW